MARCAGNEVQALDETLGRLVDDNPNVPKQMRSTGDPLEYLDTEHLCAEVKVLESASLPPARAVP